MYPSIRWSIGVAIVALVGATPQARAQSPSRLYDKWQIDLSGSVLVMDAFTKRRPGSTARRGST